MAIIDTLETVKDFLRDIQGSLSIFQEEKRMRIFREVDDLIDRLKMPIDIVP